MVKKSKVDVSKYNYSHLPWRDFPIKRVNEEDFIGKRFGHLVVLKKPLKDNNLFTVQCDCGNQNIFQANHLMNGNRTTCGKNCGLKRKK